MNKTPALLSAGWVGLLVCAACATGSKSDTPADSSTVAAGAAQTPSSGAPTDAASQWSVRLERGPCYGTCAAYTVDLSADGTVKFKGIRFVTDTIEHSAQVSTESVRALQSQISAAGFKTLPTMYVDSAKICQPYHTDAPSVTITVREGASTHTIVHDHGCGGAPPILNTLEQAIDSVAQTSQWIPANRGGKS